jgi:hypothetical protein
MIKANDYHIVKVHYMTADVEGFPLSEKYGHKMMGGVPATGII